MVESCAEFDAFRMEGEPDHGSGEVPIFSTYRKSCLLEGEKSRYFMPWAGVRNEQPLLVSGCFGP